MKSTRLIELGKIGKTHGIRGGLKLHLHNSEASSIKNNSVIYIGESKKPLNISFLKGVHSKLIIFFENIDSLSKASELVNEKVYLMRSDFNSLGSGEYYLNDLLGAVVSSTDNKVLGFVEKFYDNGAQPIAVLSTGFEFPLVKELIEKVSLSGTKKAVTVKVS